MLGDGLAELGHLLESRLILRPGVLEELRVDLVEFERRSALSELLGHRKVFLQALIDECSPFVVDRGDALVKATVHFRHRREGGPLHLHHRVKPERCHSFASLAAGFFSHGRSSLKGPWLALFWIDPTSPKTTNWASHSALCGRCAARRRPLSHPDSPSSSPSQSRRRWKC